MKEQETDLLRAVRRGVGLALAGVVLWAGAAVTDLSPALDAAAGGRTAVALLARQTGVPAADGAEQTAGERLLLRCTPLLARSWEGIQHLRTEREGAEEPADPPEEDGDRTPELASPGVEDGVLEMTARGKEGANYLSQEGVYLYNRTDKDLTTAVFTAGQVKLDLGNGPQILIYHTHGSESYTQSDGRTYTESDPYRTTDCEHNVVRVGEEMARVLREYGFEVVHDTQLHDYPAYSGAYERSGAAVRRWLEQYPTIRLALDVHRDALVGSDGSIYKLITRENGGAAAQVMLVVGTGHQGWEDNLALGVAIQRELLADYITLARPVVLRSGKYNQDCLPGSLLVEVGGHGNTLTEALAGAELFAKSLGQVLKGVK